MGAGRRERDGDGSTPPEHPTITFSPSAEFPPLSETELTALHEVGQRWRADLDGHRPRDAGLPLDPSLDQYRRPPAPCRCSPRTCSPVHLSPEQEGADRFRRQWET
jgi:hypothetical protein